MDIKVDPATENNLYSSVWYTHTSRYDYVIRNLERSIFIRCLLTRLIQRSYTLQPNQKRWAAAAAIAWAEAKAFDEQRRWIPST